MLAEAIEKLAQLATGAAAPKVVPHPAGPAHAAKLILANGCVQEWKAEPQPRSHTAGDIGALVNAIKELKNAVGASVWYSAKSIVALINDLERRDRITLPITLSKQYLDLLALDGKERGMKQEAILWWLRTVYRDCLTPSPTLVDTLRNLNWKAASETNSNLQQGRASLGRNISAQVSGAGTIPEFFTLNIPVFVNLPTAPWVNVEVALEPCVGTQEFRVMPVPGSLDRAIQTCEAWLGEQLREGLAESEDVKVYYGQP